MRRTPYNRRRPWKPALLPALAALCLPLAALAVTVDFDIQPRVLRVGEAATLTLTVRGAGNPAAPQLPPLDGFQVQAAGTEQSFSFGTGGQQRAVTFRYQLVPTRTGTFTIGPFRYAAGGQQADLAPIKVQVVAPGDRPGTEGQETQLSDLLFARLSADKTEMFNQEAFDLYLKIYSRGLRQGREVNAMNLPASGLSVQPFEELPSTREVVKGQVFDVRRFRARAQALTAGTFTLQPTIQVTLRVPRKGRRQGFFGDPFFDRPIEDFFFGSDSRQTVALTPPPLALKVKPIPTQGRPEGYSGAVGHFSFDVQVKPTEVTAGDPITITSTISGKGNIGSVSAPEIMLGDDFKVYTAKLTSKQISSDQSEGRKSFEQVVIPKSDKVKELPAVHFSYFDPEKGRFETATRGPFPLRIAPAPEGARFLVQAPAQGGGASDQVLGRDIVYLKPLPEHWLRVGRTPWYGTPAFLGIQVAPPLVLGLLLLLARRREALAHDVARARRLRAPRSARGAVRAAEAALAKGDAAAFYEALARAMAAYFGNRLNLPPGEITADKVLRVMAGGGLPEPRLDEVKTLFEQSEAHRFGAATDGGHAASKAEMQRQLKTLSGVFRACERIRL